MARKEEKITKVVETKVVETKVVETKVENLMEDRVGETETSRKTKIKEKMKKMKRTKPC